MSTPDPTPTSLPAAPDWRALCKELRDAYQRSEYCPGDYFPFTDSLINRADVALATPPAPPPEPRGCPTAPIVPRELIRALELAEAALADIGDADREPGDDIAWAERRAAQDLPRVRHALRTWRDHATPPAATREAGPLPQAPTDEDLGDLCCEFSFSTEDECSEDLLFEVFRAVLARWGGAAVPAKAAPTEEDLYDLAEVFNGDPVPAIRRALELWGGAAVPVPVSERLPETSDTIHPTGECWWFEPAADGAWYVDTYQGNYTHWLPHWALPVPAAAELEGRADG